MNPEELLAHADFVRALTRSLLQDEHRAADVSQEAWLAALRKPPISGRPVKPWLSRVVRNFTINLRRNESRRARGESRCPLPERAPSAAEITVREEARSRVVAAVQELHEPYRTTILLRFYEDLTPREVAESQKVPLETVKTRLKRGIAILRKRLDADYGNDRLACLTALVSVAGLKGLFPLEGTAKAAVGGTTAAGLSAVKLGLAFLLFLAALVAVWHALPGDSDSSGDEARRSPWQAAGGTTGSGQDRNAGTQGTDPGTTGRVRVEESGLFLSGRITDRSTSEPVVSFDFRLFGPEEHSSGRLCIHETITHREGRFFLSVPQGGTYRATVCSSRHRTSNFPGLEISAERGQGDLEWTLDPGLSLSGRVVDRATGLPVADALIGSDQFLNDAFPEYGTGFGHWVEKGFTEAEIHTRSDGNGEFTLSGLEEKAQNIAALAPGYAQAWESVDPLNREDKVALLLEPGFRITGLTLSDGGDPLAGIQVFLRGESFPLGRAYITQSDGSFATDLSLPGLVFLWARPEPGSPESEFFTAEMRPIQLNDSDVSVVLGCETPGYAAWSGTVHDSGGEPLAFGAINLTPDLGYSWPHRQQRQLFHDRYVLLDGAGRFEVRKIVPGRYDLCIVSRDGTDMEKQSVFFDGPVPVQRDVFLSAGCSIRGTVIDGNSGRPVEKEAWIFAELSHPEKYQRSFGDVRKDGTFELRGLPPGVYSIGAGYYFEEGVEARVDRIVLEQGASKEGVLVEIPSQGMIRIRLAGFDYSLFRHLVCSLSRSDGQHYFTGSDVNIMDRQGTGEILHCLEAGRWSIAVALHDGHSLNGLESEIAIHPGATAEIEVKREDLAPFHATVFVEGRLTAMKGTSLSGAAVILDPLWSDAGVEAERFEQETVRAACSAEGDFEISSLLPGQYGVAMELGSGERLSLGERIVPLSSSGYYRLSLTLPSETVTGLFVDSRTGEVIDPVSGWSRIELFDPCREVTTTSWKSPYDLRDDTPGRFRLRGVPPGDFLLLVDFRGYATRIVGGRALEDGEELDLGRVTLEPCGSLILDIELADRDRIEHFHLVADGKTSCPLSASAPITELPDGRFFCDKLPVGLFRISIEERGYRRQVFEVDLRAGQPLELTTVLLPE